MYGDSAEVSKVRGPVNKPKSWNKPHTQTCSANNTSSSSDLIKTFKMFLNVQVLVTLHISSLNRIIIRTEKIDGMHTIFSMLTLYMYGVCAEISKVGGPVNKPISWNEPHTQTCSAKSTSSS
jgi:hypothetical protein